MNTNEWQPIETAPKDGTHIIGVDKHSKVVICWYGEDLFERDKEQWLFGSGDDFSTSCYYNPFNPTHWMPLPKLPTK